MDNAQNAAVKEKKSTAKKVLTIVGNTLIWIFIAFAVLITVLAFAAQTNNDGIPTLGGKMILTVLTDSMEPNENPDMPQYEDSFYKGDIIISQKLSPEEQKSLQVGDVVTYNAGDLNQDGIDRDINTHRIVEVIKENGEVVYRTKGDHNPGIDPDSVNAEEVIGKYAGTRIPKLGSFLNYLQTPNGFLICIVIPLVLFFIYELIMFIRKFLQLKNGDKKKITAADEELIRQRAVEEYIKAQQAAAAAQQGQVPPDAPPAAKKAAEAAQEAQETVGETAPPEPSEKKED